MIVIPSKINRDERTYKLIKVYKNNRYVLYEDVKTKIKRTFTFYELGLIKDRKDIMKGFKKNPQKVKFL